MKIVVGMSGGVDSSLTAALLAEQGHEVRGVYMENWTDAGVIHGCASWPKDRKDALKVAKQIGIPFEVVNFEKEYRSKVIDYFFAEYARGRTPNPDVLCNREIKFGMLLGWAKRHGYEAVATGHYARIQGGKLLRGLDRTKDQSYFLSRLTKDQLAQAVFPLGDRKKRDVRAEATKRKLPVADKPDSQGLCFVGTIDVPAFLKQRIKAKPGPIVSVDGETIGEHEGAAFYTVGQRRGVGVVKHVPMYVTTVDVKKNTITVGHDRDLYEPGFTAEDSHWLSGRLPKPLWHGRTSRFDVAVRYRMEPQSAKVRMEGKTMQVEFDQPQRAITPGQFAVLYDGETVVGSSVINAGMPEAKTKPRSEALLR